MKQERVIKAKRKGKGRRISVVLLCAAFSVPAFGQTGPLSANDQPVAARTMDAHLNKDQSLENVQAEKLQAPKTLYFSASQMQAERQSDKNRWNPAALTQTTGLNAANIAERSGTKRGNRVAGVRGRGVLASEFGRPEDLLSVGRESSVEMPPAQVAPSREDGVITLGGSVKNSLLSPTSDGFDASVFKLDLGGRLCLGTAEECAANETRKLDLGYAKNITHGKLDGFNLQLTPHAGLRYNDDRKSAVVGALVRIGDNLREGSEMKSNTWYLFAGADAEAVTYTPTGVRRLTSGQFHLQDRIIVGDAQAGLGYRLGDADLALSYFRRQARAENYSYDEDAAALSITWKR